MRCGHNSLAYKCENSNENKSNIAGNIAGAKTIVDYSPDVGYNGMAHSEGYPSGRKGAVLKTVLEQSNKSSNLLPSANICPQRLETTGFRAFAFTVVFH